MAPPKRVLTKQSIFDRQALVDYLTPICGGDGKKAIRHSATILHHALLDAVAPGDDDDHHHRHRRLDLSKVPDIPNQARFEIPDRFHIFTTRLHSSTTSRSGDATKMVIELQDSHRVESVLMRHDTGRVTLCVSSQVGCKMGCTFCATGTLGELGNLTCGEICEQVVYAKRLAPNVRNVVFMGMGEPLNNYACVMDAIRALTDPRVFNLAPSHVTVSTVGVIPKMRMMIVDAPGVNLALSLHAPTQALREKIVPSATAFPLPALMAAVDAYLASGPKVRAMIEYCVLGNVNDGVLHAEALGELLAGRDVIVNLIPYNPTDVIAGHGAKEANVHVP